MGHTAIEWTDRVWNPVTGCTKVSQGCKNCYAERIANRRMPHGGFTDRPFTAVRCHPERLDQPLHWRKPQRVFVNSMSDLFHEDVPFQFIADVFAAMSCTTRHSYQVLTKRPQRMLEWFRWLTPDPIFRHPEQVDPLRVWPQWKAAKGNRGGYDNCGPAWPCENVQLGVSVEDQETADERIPLLLQTPAAVRFVSYEPALRPVDFPRAAFTGSGSFSAMEGLHWIIAGGESGPGARPAHPAWFRSVRDQCAAAGVAFFFKQWGGWAPHTDRDRDDPDWRADYTLTDRNPERYRILNLAGGYGFNGQRVHMMERVGKRRSGRLLDGREHSEFPA